MVKLMMKHPWITTAIFLAILFEFVPPQVCGAWIGHQLRGLVVFVVAAVRGAL